MTYTRKASHDLIDTLQCRIVRDRHEAEQARGRKEFVKAAVFEAWADATEFAMRDLEAKLPQIEAEAFLVPEKEESTEELRERLITEEMTA